MDNVTTEAAGSAPESGTTPQAARDQANRRSLEAAYDRIEQRERVIERQPVLQDAARAKASGERVLKEHEDYTAQGLPVYQSGTPATVLDSLSAAYDRSVAKERAAKQREMPPVEGDLRARLEKSREWADLAEADQRTFRRGFDEMESQRESAKFFGLSLEEAKVAAIERRLAERDKAQPLMQRAKKTEPGRDPSQVLNDYVDVAEKFKTDPKAAIVDVAKRTGSFDHLVAQVQHAAIERGISGMLDRFSRQAPDFESLVPTMAEALNRGLVRKTGHAAHDVKAAYAWARRYHAGGGRARA